MNLPFEKRKIDYHKLADVIINCPSLKEQICEDLRYAPYHRDCFNRYIETKCVKSTFKTSLSIDIDINYSAMGRVRSCGQDDVVLDLAILIYENSLLIGHRRCYLYYDNPEQDYVNFDIVQAYDRSEISKEGLEAINQWCTQQNTNIKQMQEQGLEEERS